MSAGRVLARHDPDGQKYWARPVVLQSKEPNFNLTFIRKFYFRWKTVECLIKNFDDFSFDCIRKN